MVRVDARTGIPARPGDTNVIWEAFKTGTIPASVDSVIDGGGNGGSTGGGTTPSVPGGIY
jgi:penicillin-binding protein 1A